MSNFQPTRAASGGILGSASSRRSQRCASELCARKGFAEAPVGGGDQRSTATARATRRKRQQFPCRLLSSSESGGDSLLAASLSPDGRSSGADGAEWSSQSYPAPGAAAADRAAGEMFESPRPWAGSGQRCEMLTMPATGGRRSRKGARPCRCGERQNRVEGSMISLRDHSLNNAAMRCRPWRRSAAERSVTAANISGVGTLMPVNTASSRSRCVDAFSVKTSPRFKSTSRIRLNPGSASISRVTLTSGLSSCQAHRRTTWRPAPAGSARLGGS